MLDRNTEQARSAGSRKRSGTYGRGWVVLHTWGVKLGGWGNWIDEVDGRDVDEATGVEETSIGQDSEGLEVWVGLWWQSVVVV